MKCMISVENIISFTIRPLRVAGNPGNRSSGGISRSRPHVSVIRTALDSHQRLAVEQSRGVDAIVLASPPTRRLNALRTYARLRAVKSAIDRSNALLPVWILLIAKLSASCTSSLPGSSSSYR